MHKNKTFVLHVTLLSAFLFFAVIRWPGAVSFGSDSDEAILTAQTLLEKGRYCVFDMHGTKYPPAVSLLAAAFMVLGLDPAWGVTFFNCLFVFLTGLVAAQYVRIHYGTLFAAGAGLYIYANIYVWQSAHHIIADTLFGFLTAVIAFFALHIKNWNRKSVLGVGAAVFFAAMTRSVGILLAFPAIASIWISSAKEKRTTAVLSGAFVFGLPFVALLLYMAYQKQFGAHPTDYIDSFFLADPYDAAKGAITWNLFLRRSVTETFCLIRDIGFAVVSFRGPAGFSTVCVVSAFAFLLLTGWLLRSTRQTLIILSFAIPYALIVWLWPYHGPRFALPLIPLAPIAFAEIGSRIRRMKRFSALASAAAICCFGLYLLHAAYACRRIAIIDGAKRSAVHENLNDVADWIKANVESDSSIASFDYRAVALRIQRPVVPLRYTSDVSAQISYLSRKNVDRLVVSHVIYKLRGEYANAIIEHLNPRLSPEYQNSQFAVYDLRGLLPVDQAQTKSAEP